MTADLRTLDEEIALARGWMRGQFQWEPQHGTADAAMIEAWAQDGIPQWWPCSVPPPFSSSWALAGPLLEEMAAARACPRLNGMAEHASSGTIYQASWTVEHFMEPLPHDLSRWAGASGSGGLAASKGASGPESISRAWLQWKRAQL